MTDEWIPPKRVRPSDYLSCGFLGAFIQQLLNAGYVETEDDDNGNFSCSAKEFCLRRFDEGLLVVRIGNGDGYSGFFGDFNFDAEGNLESHELYE